MRVAVIILAVLVFAALLILDTAAVLELLGSLLWAHALATAVVVLLVVAAPFGWNRLRPRKMTKQRPRARDAAARAKPPARNSIAGRCGHGLGVCYRRNDSAALPDPQLQFLREVTAREVPRRYFLQRRCLPLALFLGEHAARMEVAA